MAKPAPGQPARDADRDKRRFAPLDIGAATVTGDFQIDTDDCTGKTLSPGSTCTIKVLFSPTATGSNTGRLTVPTNGLPPTLGADLAGIGT